MNSSGLVSVNFWANLVSVNSGPIDFELQNQGRVLIIKDALYNRSTHRYHDIKLERNGWCFFGLDLGGGGKFTGITEDVARQIQATYGIALKTLQVQPNGAAFWSRGKQTSYATCELAGEKFASGKLGDVKTSYPCGEKKDDVFLAQEDANRFGASRMTLHDAINAGIWSLAGWGQRAPLPANEMPPADSSSPEPTRSGALRSPPRTRTPKRPSGTRSLQETAEKSARSQALSADESGDTASLQKSKSDRDSIEKEKPEIEAKTKPREIASKASRKGRGESTALGRKGLKSGILPTIPVYRAQSTPIEPGYDKALFEERKRRIIAHLDNSSPVPFSAFVDRNLKQKIDPSLFLRMSDALRRLAVNPKADDKDAKYMSELCKHWFRAGYHYLDQNSRPGDGYEQTLSQVAEKIKDPTKAAVKARELYWRRHATDFWMTFIDLFARERLNIDLIRKFFATETTLNSWF